MTLKSIFLSLFGGTIAALISCNGVASPQILAVAQQSEPLTFTCGAQTCIAELRTICLEKHRQTPAAGTIYRAKRPEGFKLRATDAAGRPVTLPADLPLSITAKRGWVAVEVSVPKAVLAKAGATNLSLRTLEVLALLPDAIPGDRLAHDEGEVDLATGPLRKLAASVMAQHPGRISGARFLYSFAQSLSPDEARDARGAPAYWRKLRGGIADGPAEAQPVLTRAVNNCHAMYHGLEEQVPGCLRAWSDKMMVTVGWDYWNQADQLY